MTRLDDILARAQNNLPQSLDRFLHLLSIPSVSSEPKGSEGLARCASWLADELTALGLVTRVIETAGHPVILAHSPAGPGPRALFYGHYDVQPADPVDAWTTPPFSPSIRQEAGHQRIYARGASDSKGQFWPVIEALRAWRDVHGQVPDGVTLLLEGEEETGSQSLSRFVDDYRDALACDVAFITDSDMWSPTRPAITTRLKGLVHEKLTIHGPNSDLHSGHFGTVAVNPIRLLAHILADIHDPEGRVAIEGFYDGVPEIPLVLREQWNALNVDEALAGVTTRGGPSEGGHSTVELMWGRPGIDFNGIFGGNTSDNERSVVPASAWARLSFRLVGQQDPEQVRRFFRAFVEARVPAGCRVEFEGHGGSAAVTIDATSPWIAATARALDAEWPEPTLIKGTGGTVPLVGLLADGLGVDCIVTGFILADDAIHAPNERFDVGRLHKGIRSWIRVLAEVSTHTENSEQ